MKRVALAVALLIGLATPSQADFVACFIAYLGGDDASALQECKPLAEQGDAKAQYILGRMYDLGEGVPQDYAEAAKWYRKAAEQGDAKAQFALGAMYSYGRGVPQDYVQAHKWYNLAASRYAPESDRDRAVKNRDILAAKMTPAQIAEAQQLAREWKEKHGKK